MFRLIRVIIGGVIARTSLLGIVDKVLLLRIASGLLIIADLFISYIAIFLNRNLRFLEFTPNCKTF